MHRNEFSFEVLYAMIARKNTVFHLLGPSLMNQNEFSFKVLYAVLYAVIERILFSSCWDIL